MSSLITLVKLSPIQYKRDSMASVQDASIVRKLQEKNSVTYTDLLNRLQMDVSWLSDSTQNPNTVLTTRLHFLRKVGAIVDVPATNVQTRVADTVADPINAELKAKLKAARKATKALKAEENRLLQEATAAKVKELDATIEAKDMLVRIANANADAAIQRADSAEAKVRELEATIETRDMNVRIANANADATISRADSAEAYAQELELKLEDMQMTSEMEISHLISRNSELSNTADTFRTIITFELLLAMLVASTYITILAFDYEPSRQFLLGI